MSKPLPVVLRKVIVDLIEVVADDMRNNGCNDWEFTGVQKKAYKKYLGVKRSPDSDMDILGLLQKMIGVKVTYTPEDEDGGWD